MYDPIVVDLFIIDREVGQRSELLDIVQDALLMLQGILHLAPWRSGSYAALILFQHPFKRCSWRRWRLNPLKSFDFLPFVMFYLSSFFICALDEEDAQRKTEILLEETEDRVWRVSIPEIRNWKSHVQDPKLDALYSGMKPPDDL